MGIKESVEAEMDVRVKNARYGRDKFQTGQGSEVQHLQRKSGCDWMWRFLPVIVRVTRVQGEALGKASKAELHSREAAGFEREGGGCWYLAHEGWGGKDTGKVPDLDVPYLLEVEISCIDPNRPSTVAQRGADGLCPDTVV